MGFLLTWFILYSSADVAFRGKAYKFTEPTKALCENQSHSQKKISLSVASPSYSPTSGYFPSSPSFTFAEPSYTQVRQSYTFGAPTHIPTSPSYTPSAVGFVPAPPSYTPAGQSYSSKEPSQASVAPNNSPTAQSSFPTASRCFPAVPNQFYAAPSYAPVAHSYSPKSPDLNKKSACMEPFGGSWPQEEPEMADSNPCQAEHQRFNLIELGQSKAAKSRLDNTFGTEGESRSGKDLDTYQGFTAEKFQACGLQYEYKSNANLALESTASQGVYHSSR